MILELEYNEEMDEHFIIVPDSMLRKLDWEAGDMLEYEMDDEILRIWKI